MNIMNSWYSKLNKGQVSNIYKNQKRQIGKYLAMWSESGHLNKYMITLSPNNNDIDSAIDLRKHFFKKLNTLVHYKKHKLSYFSSIEIKINKNPLSDESEEYEESRLLLDNDFNFHLHIQILTTMTKKELDSILKKMDIEKCTFYKLTTPNKKDIEYYDYVIKDIKTIDWKLQYFIKSNCKNKILHTTSRKEIANFLITKIWSYFKVKYKDNWNNINDKYSYIIDLKTKGDIVFTKVNKDNDICTTIDIKLYDILHTRGYLIYIRRKLAI